MSAGAGMRVPVSWVRGAGIAAATAAAFVAGGIAVPAPHASGAPRPPRADFEAGSLDGWHAESGSQLRLTDDVHRGHGALEITPVTPGAATVATWTVAAPSERNFFRAWVKGTAATTVRFAANGVVSAPIALDGTWQLVGLSVPGDTASVRVSIGVEAPAPGDARLVVDDVVLATSAPSRTAVVPGTRIITLNGNPLVAKGYLYWPLVIGLHWPASTWAEPSACQQDARLMGAAGVTLLRIPFEDHEPAIGERYRQCLDAFHANGISVLWLVGPPGQLEVVREETREVYAEKLLTAVRDVGDHPATALWNIGNELDRKPQEEAEIWLGNRDTGKPAMLEDLIRRTKAADDGRHLTSTTICCPKLFWLEHANVPSLDFWGINAYGEPAAANFADTFASWTAADPRPKILTETGVDRLRCLRGLLQVDPLVLSCRTAFRNPSAHSGEDQPAQRDWNLRVWDNINSLLATPQNPDGNLGGATFFMWSDLWWFACCVFNGPGNPATRDVTGAGPWSAPDGLINIEWHGVANAQAQGQTEPRVTSLAFDALARRWTGADLPAISDVEVTTTGSRITVRWNTTRPTSSEVQAGANGEVNRDGGDLIQDNTVFTRVAYDEALRTSHSLSFDAATLDPLVCVKVVARSFTSDGHSATTAPIITGCPSTGR